MHFNKSLLLNKIIITFLVYISKYNFLKDIYLEFKVIIKKRI